MSWPARPLGRFAHEHPDRLAIMTSTVTVTFAHLEDRTRVLAAGLWSAGVRAGALLPIAVADKADALAIALGALRCGATPVPLDAAAPAAEQRSAYRLANASVAVVERVDGEHVDSDTDEVGLASISWAGARAATPRAAAPQWWKGILSPGCDGNDILLTAGSPPDDARKATAMGMRPGGRALILGPLWQNGPFEMALRQLFLGGMVVLPQRFIPAEVAAVVERTRPTWALAVPTHLYRLGSYLDDLRRAFAAPLTLVHSSAPCDTALRTLLTDALGPSQVHEYYGTILYDGTFASADEWLSTGGATGRPIATTDLRIVDNDDRTAPAGTEGLIEGRSRIGMETRSARHGELSESGWFTVGDRGYFDSAGYLHFTGGPPHRVITGGTNIDIREVEGHLRLHPEVIDANVEGHADPDLGNILVATIWARSSHLTSASLDEHCQAALSRGKVPMSWVIKREGA